MFPKQQIDGFEKYWRRRKPGSSTSLHYASDIRIFFRWAGGQPPEAITVHDVDEFIRQADIWITCHQLRHTFACRMIAAEVPVTSVQKMLGHTSIRTTQLYVNVADRQVEKDYHAGIQKVIENCAILSEVSHG